MTLKSHRIEVAFLFGGFFSQKNERSV